MPKNLPSSQSAKYQPPARWRSPRTHRPPTQRPTCSETGHANLLAASCILPCTRCCSSLRHRWRALMRFGPIPIPKHCPTCQSHAIRYQSGGTAPGGGLPMAYAVFRSSNICVTNEFGSRLTTSPTVPLARLGSCATSSPRPCSVQAGTRRKNSSNSKRMENTTKI